MQGACPTDDQNETAVVLSFIVALVVCTPARSEEQLPINELYPCEVVLHELIADMNRLRPE